MCIVESPGPTMLARVETLRTLNRRVEREFNPSRKDLQGRTKLARDRS